MLDPHAIHIYTDGSCYKNPGGASGCAAIVHFPESLDLPDEQIVDFGCGESSINRMELLACIKAMEWVRRNGPWASVTRVQIVTDSRHVIDNLFRAPTWKKLDWRNVHGEWKFNPDLWDKLLKLRTKAGIRVDFVWRPRRTTELAKQVDRAAKEAALPGGIDLSDHPNPAM